jgi:hypothetical protein
VKLDMETKRKILGLNAARLYDITPEERMRKLQKDDFSQRARELYPVGAGTGAGISATMAPTSVDV